MENAVCLRYKCIFYEEFEMKTRGVLFAAFLLSLCGQAYCQNSASLLGLTQISCDKAEAIALAKYPGGTVTEISIERDDLPLAWSVSLDLDKKTEVELEIDAGSGQILKVDKHGSKN